MKPYGFYASPNSEPVHRHYVRQFQIPLRHARTAAVPQRYRHVVALALDRPKYEFSSQWPRDSKLTRPTVKRERQRARKLIQQELNEYRLSVATS
jgi:hypothetical protein